MKKDKKINEFDLEEQYKILLDMLNLDESLMHLTQKEIMKNTFYGASLQMFLLLTDSILRLPEKESTKKMEDMYNQITNFFKKTNNERSK